MRNARSLAFLTLVGGLALRSSPALAEDRAELVVFAAASLRESFEALVPVFENQHPGTRVRLNLAGSQELRTQVEQGAAADVFAAADPRNMAALARQGLVDAPEIFARNQPVIAVPRGNPAGIASLSDLRRTKRLVIGAPEVPIGGYTMKIFDAAARKYGPAFRSQLDAAVVSRELNVRQVLAKVTLGEADAAVVYRTDAQAARDKVDVIAIPADLNVQAEYPIAVVAASKHTSLARAWVQLVQSGEGQRRLTDQGFLPAAAPRVGDKSTKVPAPAASVPAQAPSR
jgi:molybdate transport system substrate-binding protein